MAAVPVNELPLLFAVVVPLAVALLLALRMGGGEGTDWHGALLLIASLTMTVGVLLLARRRQALAVAEARVERRLAELDARIGETSAALAAGEGQLRRMLRIGQVGGFEIDLRSGRNQRSGEYMMVQGLPGEARLERHQDWVARLHPDDRERAEHNVLHAFSDTSGVTDYAQEYRIVAPSGEVRHIAARAEIERDAEGRGLRMVGVHVDVTELKLAEAARRASEERLRLAQQAVGLGLWERDLRTGSVVWSPEQFRLMGLDPAKGPPDRAAMCALVLPEDRPKLVLEQLDRNGAPLLDDGSFRHQIRIRRPVDGEVRTVLALGRVFRCPDGHPVRVVGLNLDITSRTRAEHRQTLMMRELDHRAKNALAVVQAALRLTPRDDPDAFARAVEGRVAAITRAHTLLAKSGWNGAGLHAVLRGEIGPFLDHSGRALLDGPAVVLAAVAAQPLAMAVHELAANALKYGALSAAGGRVAVRWWVEDERVLRIDWVETGGPPTVGPPPRRGFGRRVIEATLGGQLGGKLETSWAPSGLACAIALPVERVVARADRIQAAPEIAFDRS